MGEALLSGRHKLVVICDLRQATGPLPPHDAIAMSAECPNPCYSNSRWVIMRPANLPVPSRNTRDPQRAAND